MVQRVFATSKLWYKATALPLPLKFSKKFQALMSRFLWAGKLERLQIDETKNKKYEGGLGLPCVISKANALFLTQSCRLLLNSDSKEYGHVKYWLGLHLREYIPDLAGGPHAEIISPYFQHMRLLLVEGFIFEDIDASRLKKVNSKDLYMSFTSSFPPPKITYKYDVDWSLVWMRLDSPVLDPQAREYLFMIINNIVPNRDRLYTKMHMVNSPNCLHCKVREDNTHLFMECVMVQEAWGWVRLKLLSILPVECAITSNFEFLHLMFQNCAMDDEAVWLLGGFLEFVWLEKFMKNRHIKLDILMGFLELKYKANQFSKKPKLNHIIGIIC